MEKIKSMQNNGNREIKASLNLLKKQADAFVSLKDILNVVNKQKTAVSDDLHDYVSMATYYWPNPNVRSGIPYIRKDGKTNPEVNKIRDLHNLTSLCKRVEVLSLAFYYFGDRKYADKANSLLRGWFIDTKTKMNPNFDHAQFIRGKNKGRIEGIVEARNFVNLLDGVLLLKSKNGITNADYLSIKNWFTSFLNWMENNNTGRMGDRLSNNIGTCYQLQKLTYSIFTGKNQLDRIVENGLKPLLDKQFDEKGGQEEELSRTKPIQYSIANLDYWGKIELILRNRNYSSDFIDKNIFDGLNYINNSSLKGENLDNSHAGKISRMNKKYEKINNNIKTQKTSTSNTLSLEDVISLLTIDQ
jgi:hypothetical protein